MIDLSLVELETFDSRAARGRSERRFLCPACGMDKPRDAAHRSLAVNARTGAWTCHRCGNKGLLKEFWTQRENTQSFATSRRARTRAALAHAFALPERSKTPASKPDTDDAKIRAAWVAWQRAPSVAETPGATYLAGRGANVSLAAQAGVRFSPNFYGQAAVLFPVVNRMGEVVAVSSRFTNPRGDFKTMSIGSKSSGVFVTPGALTARLVAVTEAPIDALALAAAGIPAIALIGCSAPAWLLAHLASRDVLVATDADTAGDTVADSLMPQAQARGGRVLRLRARGAKDWGEVLEKHGETRLRAFLAAFAPRLDDELRAMHAFRLHYAGRGAAGLFLTGLIARGDLRESVRARLCSPDARLSGEALATVRFPAAVCEMDETAIAECEDAQRLPH
jgi:predicted RNA-binding Zn-ribbon protein involved in translation (DUF1610 family)